MVLSSSVRVLSSRMEAQGIGFLALGKFVALVNVEQRNALQQFALGGEGRVAQRRKKGHLFVHQQGQVAFHFGELRKLLGAIFCFFVDFTRASKFISR